MEFSQTKFLALNFKQQHKVAAKALNFYHEHAHNLAHLKRYNQMALCLALPPIGTTLAQRQQRYEHHMQLSLEERLPSLRGTNETDTLTSQPFGTVDTYLDNLRSAHNVGSIMRSLEAFRLGKLWLSPLTPGPDNPKVIKASMGTSSIVPCHRISQFEKLPTKPLIVIETGPKAVPLEAFTFPTACTLVFGNEAYGVSAPLIEAAHHVVCIPLVGGKNSLNVANTVAIVAAFISAQQRQLQHI